MTKIPIRALKQLWSDYYKMLKDNEISQSTILTIIENSITLMFRRVNLTDWNGFHWEIYTHVNFHYKIWAVS